MGAAVETSGLVKSYGHRLALRGLDLMVDWGEFLTVFGPNGSGKTTLIKVLATIARPTAGLVCIAGLDPRHQAPQVHRSIGVVTHQTFLYDDLTAYENLKFYGRMFGLRDIVAQIESLSQKLGLAPYLDLRVRTLSHGTQQRVSLARALLHTPRLLLLDEPETGLDQQARGLLAELLAAHRAEGGSVLMTTHNLELGLAMGDQVAILSNGRIAYQGTRDGLDIATLRETYARYTGMPA